MKGVVFTEFIEMVEAGFGFEMVDDLLENCDLPSGGTYTAVGSYSHTELVSMVVRLSEKTGTPVPDLVNAFGRHLYKMFARTYPQFFPEGQDAFEFLESVENHIHVEVRKLYPDAQLPTFVTERPDEQTMIMDYHSVRHFEDLCEGLIAQCVEDFGMKATISRETIADGDCERFTITRQAA